MVSVRVRLATWPQDKVSLSASANRYIYGPERSVGLCRVGLVIPSFLSKSLLQCLSGGHVQVHPSTGIFHSSTPVPSARYARQYAMQGVIDYAVVDWFVRSWMRLALQFMCHKRVRLCR